mgnify:CR=1 FL=1
MSQSETITRLFEKIDEQTKILHEVDKNVTALNQKTLSYDERLHNLELLITRIEKLETNISVISCSYQNLKYELVKIPVIIADLTRIKRDYKWVCGISAFVGWFIGLVISFFK